MSLPVFLVDPGSLASGDSLRLSGAEGHHAARVLRLRVGEQLAVTDGQGCHGVAKVTQNSGDSLDVLMGEVSSDSQPSPKFTVVQALPKAERGELAVELMTEVGVDAIVPWQAARCVSVWRDEKKQARGRSKWQSAADSAAKQSRRVWWPRVAEVADTAAAYETVRGSVLAVVLHEGAQESLATVQTPPAGRVTLVVGPEGGLTDAEVDGFAQVGAHVARMGPNVMRTSTAGAVALAVLMANSIRWSH